LNALRGQGLYAQNLDPALSHSEGLALLLATLGGSLACLQSPLLKLTTWILRASIVESVMSGSSNPGCTTTWTLNLLSSSPLSPSSATSAASLSSRPLFVASAVETSTGPPQAQLLREHIVDRKYGFRAVRTSVHEDDELLNSAASRFDPQLHVHDHAGSPSAPTSPT